MTFGEGEGENKKKEVFLSWSCIKHLGGLGQIIWSSLVTVSSLTKHGGRAKRALKSWGVQPCHLFPPPWYTGSGSPESGCPGFKTCLLHLPACMTMNKLLNLPVLQFPDLLNTCNTSLTGLLGGWTETVYLQRLARCLAHSKCSVHGGSCYCR